jgi:hypothetical protein
MEQDKDKKRSISKRLPEHKMIDVRRHITLAGGFGGMCVYAWHEYGNSWVNIATSICSKDDVYVKKTANELIGKAIAAGQFIRVPIPNYERRRLLPRDLRAWIDNGFLRGFIVAEEDPLS